jgi:hypothetical protein
MIKRRKKEKEKRSRAVAQDAGGRENLKHL